MSVVPSRGARSRSAWGARGSGRLLSAVALVAHPWSFLLSISGFRQNSRRRSPRLPRTAAGEISVLRTAGTEPRSDLGLCRNPEPRTRRFFCPRRLLYGHVPDAPDRYTRRLRKSAAARLHGLPQLEGVALVLVGVRPFCLCGGYDHSRPRFARVGVRLARLSLARYRGLSLDHHASDDLRLDARFFP